VGTKIPKTCQKVSNLPPNICTECWKFELCAKKNLANIAKKIYCTLRSCILNFWPNFRVGFRVRTSFRESRRVRKAWTLPKYFRNSSSDSFRLVPTLIFAIFLQKLGSERVFASRDEFGGLGHYWNISEIRKKPISETREIENFRKKRLTQGLTAHQI